VCPLEKSGFGYDAIDHEDVQALRSIIGGEGDHIPTFQDSYRNACVLYRVKNFGSLHSDVSLTFGRLIISPSPFGTAHADMFSDH
jgi:hypothetical protein